MIEFQTYLLILKTTQNVFLSQSSPLQLKASSFDSDPSIPESSFYSNLIIIPSARTISSAFKIYQEITSPITWSKTPSSLLNPSGDLPSPVCSLWCNLPTQTTDLHTSTHWGKMKALERVQKCRWLKGVNSWFLAPYILLPFVDLLMKALEVKPQCRLSWTTSNFMTASLSVKSEKGIFFTHSVLCCKVVKSHRGTKEINIIGKIILKSRHHLPRVELWVFPCLYVFLQKEKCGIRQRHLA